MQITRSSIDTQKGPADWFTGDVYIDAVAAPAGDLDLRRASVRFTPGARTAWHTHPHGQTISSPRASASASARAARSRHPSRRPRLLRARREPLARRRPEPLHGPHRHAAERRVGQPRHLGRARHRRAVRERRRPSATRWLASSSPAPPTGSDSSRQTLLGDGHGSSSTLAARLTQ